MKTDYFLYMNEAEGTGLVDTRFARINAAINELVDFSRKGFDVMDTFFQEDILEKYDMMDITKKEFLYFLNELKKRIS